MPEVALYAGDNRRSLRRLIDEGVRVHSVVTDPPYGLVSIQKRFGKKNSAPARKYGNDGSFSRLSGGFMGKLWDSTGIERDPEFWKLIYDILLPGGIVFAFAGARTGHWQAVAMEAAGFIMHPMHIWAYGTGFAKAHAADKSIDRELGMKGRIEERGRPVKRMIPGADQHRGGSWIKDNGREYQPGTYLAASPEAEEWSGYAYGTQTQKPALEPIYLAQKPFSEKNGAANILKHGVGAFNIDDCRVPVEGSQARYPSNLILDGSPEIVSMFPRSKGQRGAIKGDGGSVSRFFHQFPHDLNAIIYHGKAGKIDRDEGQHPTVKPIGLLRYLIRHITPPGGIVLDPFAGSGTTAEAAKFEGFNSILMEAEPEYVDFLKGRLSLSHRSTFMHFVEEMLKK